jgi:hypothetical protein
MYQYIVSSLGAKFMEPSPTPVVDAVHEANQATPLLFILSPGMETFEEIEKKSRKRKRKNLEGNIFILFKVSTLLRMWRTWRVATASP